jgi:hypothetical protein
LASHSSLPITAFTMSIPERANKTKTLVSMNRSHSDSEVCSP